MKTKQLYIVLTRSNTVLSSLIHHITRDNYTHAALSLDSNCEYMFSFGRRHANNPFIGCFKRERLNDAMYEKYGELPGVILELSVTSAEYRQVTGIIGDFILNSHRYGYNYIGLMSSLLGVENCVPNRFLCSEFVYHVLNRCGICDFGLPRSLIRPQDLLHVDGTVLYEGDLKRYSQYDSRQAVYSVN